MLLPTRGLSLFICTMGIRTWPIPQGPCYFSHVHRWYAVCPFHLPRCLSRREKVTSQSTATHAVAVLASMTWQEMVKNFSRKK